MRAEGPFDRRDPQGQAAQIARAAEGWRISVPAAGLWTRSAAGRVSPGPARWSLEYDPRLRLVSYEVWADGVCVFGIDDLVG